MSSKVLFVNPYSVHISTADAYISRPHAFNINIRYYDSLYTLSMTNIQVITGQSKTP